MNIRRISPAEAHALMRDEGYVYLDVRTQAEFAAGRPKGAVNIPVMVPGPSGMVPSPDFVDACAQAFSRDAKLVLGCRSGQRSMRAAEALLGAGYTGLVEQRAGFEGARNAFGQVTEKGWLAEGLPVEQG
jgi:rhodanese-related sulfurtransferase